MRTRPPISLLQSFRVAGRGFAEAFSEQRNLRIHLGIVVVVVAVATWLQVSLADWVVLCLCISQVLTLELLNTAIETVVDLVSPGEHELARKAKDISAAAVLLAALLAVVIGCGVLGPPLIRLWIPAATPAAGDGREMIAE